jgi:hypothetical protein
VARRKNGNPRVPVTIRLPQNLVIQIDEALEECQVPISRNNWLLEAAVEKLARKSDRGGNGTE